jgi:hypothetical protein
MNETNHPKEGVTMPTMSVSKDPESVHVELDVDLDEIGSIESMVDQFDELMTDVIEEVLKTGLEAGHLTCDRSFNVYSDTVLFTGFGIKTMNDSQKVKPSPTGGDGARRADEGVLRHSPRSFFLTRPLGFAERCQRGKKCEQNPLRACLMFWKA